MQPEFILVTGANGTGKTTLIEANRETLERAGFDIIIPDDILKYATSHTDAPVVIGERIEEALHSGRNIVLESPFQFDSLKSTIEQLREGSYQMSLYQLYLDSPVLSVSRVQERYATGGLYIGTEEVLRNFEANMRNVADQYSRFDHAYFIDTADETRKGLTVVFKHGGLIHCNPTDSPYIRDLFMRSREIGGISDRHFSIIWDNIPHIAEEFSKLSQKPWLRL